MDDLTLSDLPVRWREVAEIIGLQSALELVRLRGGRTVYVPCRDRLKNSRLQELVPDAAGLLSLHFGGEELPVPRLTALERSARDRAIIAARKAGHTVADIADRFGLTERHTWRVVRGYALT